MQSGKWEKESAFLFFRPRKRTGVTASRFHLLSRATRATYVLAIAHSCPDLDASAIFFLTRSFFSFFLSLPPRKEHAAWRFDAIRTAALNIYIFNTLTRKGAHLSNSAFRPREFNISSARTAFIFNRRARSRVSSPFPCPRSGEKEREREKIARKDKEGEKEGETTNIRSDARRRKRGKRGSRATSNRAGRIRR